jgi:hypothetical protein
MPINNVHHPAQRHRSPAVAVFFLSHAKPPPSRADMLGMASQTTSYHTLFLICPVDT